MGIFSDAEEVALDAAGSAARLAEGMIRRAVISLVNDAFALAKVQVKLLDAEPEPALLFQHYGFVSNPPVGSEAIVIRVGGVPEHQIVIATSKRDSRPKVDSGEVKIYVESGQLIHITTSAIKLGDDATKGVAREDDVTQSVAAADAWISQVQNFINGLAPGTISPGLTHLFATIVTSSDVVKAQ